MIDRRRLVDDLRAIGVGDDDVVMVHASLRRVGPIEGGAAMLVEALDEVAGTWMMTLGAIEQDEVDPQPFEALVTPADPEIGVLAEVMRTAAGTVASDHPEGRFGARGGRAAWLMADQPWHHYYGVGSPLAKLVEVGGAVLRLGAADDTITLTHHAEYLCDVPDKRLVVRRPLVKGADGPVVRPVECIDDSDGIVDRDYFPEILDSYRAAGHVRTGRIGNADAELLDAAEYVTFATAWMNANLT